MVDTPHLHLDNPKGLGNQGSRSMAVVLGMEPVGTAGREWLALGCVIVEWRSSGVDGKFVEYVKGT